MGMGEYPSETPLGPSALLQIKVAAAAVGTAEKNSGVGKQEKLAGIQHQLLPWGECPAFQQMFGFYSS